FLDFLAGIFSERRMRMAKRKRRDFIPGGILGDLGDFPPPKPPAKDDLLPWLQPPPLPPPMGRSLDRGGRPRNKGPLLPVSEDLRTARTSIKRRGAVKRAISDLAEACGQDDETIKKRLRDERKWKKGETLDGNGILSGYHPSTPVWGGDDESQG